MEKDTSEGSRQFSRREILEGALKGALTAAAAIIIGQRGRQTPVAVIRGIHYTRDLESSMSKVLHR